MYIHYSIIFARVQISGFIEEKKTQGELHGPGGETCTRLPSWHPEI